MPRLPYLDEKTARVSPSTLAAVLERRRGKLGNLDGLLLYSDPIARGWNTMFGAIRSETALEPRIREIAILRVGVLTRAVYEHFQHSKVALAAGMTQNEVDEIAAWHRSDCFDEPERAVLAYTDAMTG